MFTAYGNDDIAKKDSIFKILQKLWSFKHEQQPCHSMLYLQTWQLGEMADWTGGTKLLKLISKILP